MARWDIGHRGETMSAALVIVYACLAAVEAAVVVAWVVATRKHRWPVRPSTADVVIGGVTSFLDTLGIGTTRRSRRCSSCAGIRRTS